MKGSTRIIHPSAPSVPAQISQLCIPEWCPKAPGALWVCAHSWQPGQCPAPFLCHLSSSLFQPVCTSRVLHPCAESSICSSLVNLRKHGENERENEGHKSCVFVFVLMFVFSGLLRNESKFWSRHKNAPEAPQAGAVSHHSTGNAPQAVPEPPRDFLDFPVSHPKITQCLFGL